MKKKMISGPVIREVTRILPTLPGGPDATATWGGHGTRSDGPGLAENESPWGPFESSLAAAMNQVAHANLYPQSGFESLRQALARHFGVAVDRVAAGAGSSALIHHLSVALLDAGTNIVTCAPTVTTYAHEAQKQGGHILQVPVRHDGSHDLPAMLAAINSKTRMVYVCNPNDPTGMIVGREELRDFVDAVPTAVTIVVDEGYAEYVVSANFPNTITEDGFHRRNLVTLRTFSKAYGMAGLRVGYLVGSPEIVVAVQKVQSNYEVSAIAQSAAIASLQDGDELDRRVAVNRRGVADLQSELGELGFEALPSFANFVYVKASNPNLLARKLLFGGVLARPCTGLGGLAGVRLPVGTPSQVSTTIAALRGFVNALPDGGPECGLGG